MGREAITAALAAALGTALPDARIEGFAGAPATPDRIDAGGLVELEEIGEGEAETDLNPVTYHKTALYSLVVAAPTKEAAGAMLAAIGAMLVADRTLGGTCEWADAQGPAFDEAIAAGSEGHFEARPTLSAEYTTTNPLE